MKKTKRKARHPKRLTTGRHKIFGMPVKKFNEVFNSGPKVKDGN